MKLYSKRFLHLTIHKGAVLGHVGIAGSGIQIWAKSGSDWLQIGQI